MKKTFYFIGILGTGMSSLAVLLKGLGYTCLGSDLDLDTFTRNNLIENNIKVLKYNINNLKQEYVYILQSENNSIEANYVKNNYKYYYYHQFLSLLKFDNTIAISGTHGKTTTTSLLAHIFDNENYLIGNSYAKGNKNSKMFIFEACEYKDHFLSYRPKISVILNVEMDHTDYFKSKNQLINSFNLFSKYSNMCIYNGDDISLDGISFGFKPNNDYVICNDTILHNGEIIKLCNPFHSEKMMYNVTACFIICEKLGVDRSYFLEKLRTFQMPKRRFNCIEKNGYTFIDDYAHHPTELINLLEMCKKFNKKIVVIFEPHQFERLVFFQKEFYHVLKDYDAYILDLYNARSNENHNIDFFIKPPLKEFKDFIIENYKDYLIVYAGAGHDINYLFKKIFSDT